LKNKYKICDGYAIIYVTQRNGKMHEIKIDLDVFEILKSFKYSWHVWLDPNNGKYYAMCTVYTGMVDGKPTNQVIYMHRIIMGAGAEDHVDHKDPNETLDNRKSNLRLTTHYYNSKNRKGKNKNNTSTHRNVSLDKRRNEWMVQLQDKDGKNRCWRRFPFEQLEEASKYAEFKRQELYGEFAGKD
jgi:hypothetical protein